MWVLTFTRAYGQTVGFMASAMAGEVAEVVEDSVVMMARLFGGAARLGGTQGESGAGLREDQDQIALITM